MVLFWFYVLLIVYSGSLIFVNQASRIKLTKVMLLNQRDMKTFFLPVKWVACPYTINMFQAAKWICSITGERNFFARAFGYC